MSRLLEDDDNRKQVELDSELPVRWKLGCGAIAGAVGQSGECHMTSPDHHMTRFVSIVTYPLDVLRRRMQMKGTMGEKFPYRSSPHAAVTIYRTEGVLGFYKGMLPNLLKVAPSIAIAFVTYEFVKAWLFGVKMTWR